MSNTREEYEKEFVRQAFNITSTNSRKKLKKTKGNSRINFQQKPKPSP